ncbi:MAG: TIGR01777 family protein [Bacteroidetes bacterium]|nr:TIGR01777 family protein [Bacteroidota bacterium]
MKTNSKLILAGGSGQIGRALLKYLKDDYDEIVVLTRGKEYKAENCLFVRWDGKTKGEWFTHLENADVLINLTGKNVNCRYTEKNKKEIFDSRTNSIEILAAACRDCINPPKLWIQSASATLYRHALDRPMDEFDHEVGSGFSVDVCKKWEGTFWEQTKDFPQMRKVVLRISMVLSKDDGVYPRLKNLVRAGLGGKQGNGKQMVSWVHEADVAGVIKWISTHEEKAGVYNCTSPEPVSNSQFMLEMRKSLHSKIGLPSPKWLLEMGAILIGTETELVLKSRWVLPTRLGAEKYKFQFPKLDSALTSFR